MRVKLDPGALLRRVWHNASAAPASRYSSVAIILHWSIAALITAQMLMGWRMSGAEGPGRASILGFHQGVGILILVLTAMRVAWRFRKAPPPAMPGDRNEQLIAKTVHGAFYALLLVLPLTGWALSSLQSSALSLFGVIPWPSLPFLSALAPATQDAAAEGLDGAHGLLAWLMLGLLAAHVAGALKHHFIDKTAVLARMAPGAVAGKLKEPRLLVIPVAAALLAAAVYLPRLPQPPARPKPQSVASADLFLDVVNPALQARCAACHNDAKRGGGLSVVSYKALTKGGREGPTIVPGKADESDLVRRITLPSSHADYMPKDGKTPLSGDEVKAVVAWVQAGAPASAIVSQLELPPQAMDAISIVLGFEQAPSGAGGVARPVEPEEPLPEASPASDELIGKLEGAGFVVRRLSKDSNLIDADYVSPQAITPEQLALLQNLAPQLIKLNLRRSGVTDADLAALSSLKLLRHLRLEGNDISDAGVARLTSLPNLLSLNLVDTNVTDRSLNTLVSMPKLRRVYAWQSGVTARGAAAVTRQKENLAVQLGVGGG